jgi:hypothetical protein
VVFPLAAGDGTWSPAELETVSAADLSSAGAFSLTVPSGSAVVVGFGGSELRILRSGYGRRRVTANSSVSAHGQNLGFVERGAPWGSLPETPAGVQATVTDAAGVTRPATLAYVSPSQVDFRIPDGAAPGLATVSIAGASGTVRIHAAAH